VSIDFPFFIAHADAPDPKCSAIIEVFSTGYELLEQQQVYLLKEFRSSPDNVRITQSVEPVPSNSFALCEFRINWIHISTLLQCHVKTAIEERNILNPLELLQARSDNQQRCIIVSAIS
jgi:hypothetical protein